MQSLDSGTIRAAMTESKNAEEIPNYIPIPTYDPVLKIILVGEMGVGKTTLLRQFSECKVDPDRISTVQVDYRERSIKVQGNHMKLEIWDTVGQEKHRRLTNNFYRGSQGALIVYDITRRESFDALNLWLQALDGVVSEDLPKILIGNKTDLEVNRVIKEYQGEEFASSLGIPFLETSALKLDDVEKAFVMLVNEYLAKQEVLAIPSSSNQAEVRNSIILQKDSNPVHDPKASGCCRL